MTEPAPILKDEPADERDYRPNSLAQMLKNGRTSVAQARSVRQGRALGLAQKLWVSRAQPFAYSGLAEPEPWPHPVTTLELLHDLDVVVSRHLRQTAAQRHAMVLWIAHTWVVAWCAASPRLALTSVPVAAGRSTALRLLAALTPRPLAAVSAAAQSLVTLIDEVHPTLLFDDAHAWSANNLALCRLLAAGHARDAVYLNATRGPFERPAFSCYTPCAFATTAAIPEQIAKRSIRIALEPVLAHERPEPLPAGDPSPFEKLRAKTVRWAQDEGHTIAASDPQVPSTLGGSHVQNWRPLLAIAQAADPAWVGQSRAAALALSAADSDADLNIALLSDLRTAFGANDRLTSEQIVKTLLADEERPWRRMANGRPLDARALAQRLRWFGVRPRVVRTGGEAFARGYIASDCADAFGRYLPAAETEAACVHA